MNKLEKELVIAKRMRKLAWCSWKQTGFNGTESRLPWHAEKWEEYDFWAASYKDAAGWVYLVSRKLSLPITHEYRTYK